MKKIIIIDDDELYCNLLSKALIKKQYEVRIALNGENAICLTKAFKPDFAIVDLKIPGTSGLVLIPKLKSISSMLKIIVLTGYASIATAVESVKLGAIHYLVKPTNIEEILAVFENNDNNVIIPEQTMSIERRQWEYIQQILQNNNGNISQTAKELGMYRRTLQRKLAKKPIKS